MTALFATILAVIPKVFLGILGKLVTEQFLQSVMEKVLISGMKKAASMTTNSVDDALVLDVEQRLKSGA